MKSPFLIVCFLLGFLLARGAGAESLDEALQRAGKTYEQKHQLAAGELIRARERIAVEKSPLLRDLRAAEDRILALERELLRLQTQEKKSEDRQQTLRKEQAAARKTIAYVNNLARDGLKVFTDGAGPGEMQILAERLQVLQQSFETATTSGSAGDAAAFLSEWTHRANGGYTAAGQAIHAEDHNVRQGTFVLLGPETFFLPEQGLSPGTVRTQTGSAQPLYYVLPAWAQREAAALAGGQPGRVMLDPSGGKALRLKETTGTMMEHIHSGGTVSYVIIATGVLALLIIAQKLYDLSQMRLHPSGAAQEFLKKLAAGSTGEAEKLLGKLGATTRELFAAGLKGAHLPKTLLEEHLQSLLHRQQMRFERRLPLLAVIATAAPLMGLLGTVTGMVKTFALITVFGTGNAAKLSAGISEVLVATELGLVVAIPALVVHGFLTQRIRKNLAQLDQYAMEFIIANETARLPVHPVPPVATPVR